MVTNNIEQKSFWKKMLAYEYDIIATNIRFIVFVLALTIIYIYNGHHYENVLRDITKELKTIRKLNYEHTYLQEFWMKKTKESVLESKLKKTRLKSSKTPPYRIP